MQGAFVQPEMPVPAPADATAVIDNTVEGAYVTAGTQLAVAYDFSTIYVTARVDETDIDDVHPGQRVDIEVDAFPGADLTGTVREVQGGAAGVFSILPESNTSGNFQKVTHVIPVEITIDQPGDLALVPGMNVTVKIHKG
jgi:multidrug resistance efflux pump